jgi:Uroporphyrinogen decarboxylase (URO-D)
MPTMPAAEPRMTILERVDAVLSGRKPDRLPFLDRLENWHRCHTRAGTLPGKYADLTLPEIYCSVGMGQQKFVLPYGLRLRGVEVTASFNGEPFYRETEPVFESFPGMWDVVASDRPGATVTQLVTPAGKLTVRHETLPETVAMGAEPYLREHLIKDLREDYRTVEYILERAEFVPQYEKLSAEEVRIGGAGYVVPLVHRIPFQQVLLEYLGEVRFFYALHDDPGPVQRLLTMLDQQLRDILRGLAGMPASYVEFPDNLHGGMTNPRLFARYCLPAFQRYAEILHGQGKKAGSHTDGDVGPLLALLRESGLDVCESISPFPLTSCSFEDIWSSWQGGPIIWGGIPSPILEEERTGEAAFRRFVSELLHLVGAGPVILGVGDLVMGNNSIERVKYIAEQVEAHQI